MDTKKLTIIAIITLVLIGAALTLFNSLKGPTGTVKIQKAPSDMKLTIDGKEYKETEIELPVGKHTIKGEREDFIERTASISITEGEIEEQLMLLDPLNAVGTRWLEDHPEEAILYSKESSSEYDKSAQAMTENSPITNDLPILAPSWRIDYGESVRHKNVSGAIAVYIYAATPADRQDALSWIRQQGYDPSDYEIIYMQV